VERNVCKTYFLTSKINNKESIIKKYSKRFGSVKEKMYLCTHNMFIGKKEQ
jgi:hypothetical protein